MCSFAYNDRSEETVTSEHKTLKGQHGRRLIQGAGLPSGSYTIRGFQMVQIHLVHRQKTSA